MSDWKERLADEYQQLDARVQKLEAFVLSPQIDQVSIEDKQDLKEQLYLMLAYRQILARRIARL